MSGNTQKQATVKASIEVNKDKIISKKVVQENIFLFHEGQSKQKETVTIEQGETHIDEEAFTQ